MLKTTYVLELAGAGIGFRTALWQIFAAAGSTSACRTAGTLDAEKNRRAEPRARIGVKHHVERDPNLRGSVFAQNWQTRRRRWNRVTWGFQASSGYTGLSGSACGYAFESITGFTRAACVGTFAVSDTNLTRGACYVYTTSIDAILACSALVYTNAVAVADLAVVACGFTKAAHAVRTGVAAPSAATGFFVSAATVRITCRIEAALFSRVAQVRAFAIHAFLAWAATLAPLIRASLTSGAIVHAFSIGTNFATAARNPCARVVASGSVPISIQGVALGLGVVGMFFWTCCVHGFEFQRISVNILKADEGCLSAWICRGVGAAAYRACTVFVIRKPVRADAVASTAAWLYEPLTSERSSPFARTHFVSAGIGVADGYAGIVLAVVAGWTSAFAVTTVRSAYQVGTIGGT